MSKEILVIFVGQPGINIAREYIPLVFDQFGIDKASGKSKVPGPVDTDTEDARHVLLYKASSGKYIPRCLVMDFEKGSMDRFHRECGHLVPGDLILHHHGSTGGNFARAQRLARMRQPKITTMFQKLVEQGIIEHLEGIIVVHGLGGGMGTGFLDVLLETLRMIYATTPVLAFSVFPSQRISTNVVEAYNTVYGIQVLQNTVQGVVVIDNESMYDMLHEQFDVPYPSFEHVNALIVKLLFGIVSQFTFPRSIQNIDFNKLFTNLVPFEAHKFLVPALYPVKPDIWSRVTERTVVDTLFNESYHFTSIPIQHGSMISCVVLFQGDVSPASIHESMTTTRAATKFVPWVPTGITVGMNLEVLDEDAPKQAYMLFNHTSIKTVFQRVHDQFNLMFSKEAFLHWFMTESIESVERLYEYNEQLDALIRSYEELEE